MDQVMLDEFKSLPDSIFQQEKSIVELEVETTIQEEEKSLVVEEYKKEIYKISQDPLLKQEFSNQEKRDIALKSKLLNDQRYLELSKKVDDAKNRKRIMYLNLEYSKRMFRMYESLSRC